MVNITITMFKFTAEKSDIEEGDYYYECEVSHPNWCLSFAYDKHTCYANIDDVAVIQVSQSNGPQTEVTARLEGNNLTIRYEGDPASLLVNYILNNDERDSFIDCVKAMMSLSEPSNV